MGPSSQPADSRITCMLRVVLRHFEGRRLDFETAVSLLAAIIDCDRQHRAESEAAK